MAANEGKLTIGIRRNIPTEIYKELQRKGVIRGGELEQFIVQVDGSVDAEVKAMVELNCRREKDRLVVISDVIEPS